MYVHMFGNPKVSEARCTVLPVAEEETSEIWRPRRVRGNPASEAQYDVLHEGVPAWLRPSLLAWLKAHMNAGRADSVQRRLQLPIPPSDAVVLGVLAHAEEDEENFLDVVDAVCAQIVPTSSAGAAVTRMLREANSAWSTEAVSPVGMRLVRVVDETVTAAVRESTTHGRAGEHLQTAWVSAYSRDPNASHAYNKAVRAVEAAARPVVTPKDQRATLGKMITALTDAPQKWTVVLAAEGLNSVKSVAAMCELIHRAQLDRHGTDIEDVPLDVSLNEAQAAVHVAATLVQLFSSGAITPAEPR